MKPKVLLIIPAYNEAGNIEKVVKDLEKNAKIKVTIRFKGRQMAHTEIGCDVMLKFAARLDDISTITDSPKLEGRTMTMMLAPKK